MLLKALGLSALGTNALFGTLEIGRVESTFGIVWCAAISLPWKPGSITIDGSGFRHTHCGTQKSSMKVEYYLFSTLIANCFSLSCLSQSLHFSDGVPLSYDDDTFPSLVTATAFPSSNGNGVGSFRCR